MADLFAALEEPARLALQALANGVAQGILLVMAVAVVLPAFRNAGAATRHFVWFAALATVLALPAVALFRLWPSAAPAVGAPVAAAAAGAQPWSIVVPSGAWVLFLLAAAALVALARLARVGIALRSLRHLKRESRPMPTDYRALLDSHLAPFRFGRSAELRVSAAVRTPITIGFAHPAILIPPGLLAQLDSREVARLALHEMAHLRRADDWTNLAQRLAEAVFFFHPAVLWIGRRLDLERELACDDYAVAAFPGERAYARCLARLAELAAEVRPRALAPGIAPRGSQLARRVGALLAPNRRARCRVSAAECLGAGALLAAAAGAILSVAPTVALATQVRALTPEPADAAPIRTPRSDTVPVPAVAPPRPFRAAVATRAGSLKPVRAPVTPRGGPKPVVAAPVVELIPVVAPVAPVPAPTPAPAPLRPVEAPTVQPAPPSARAPRVSAPHVEIGIHIPAGGGLGASAEGVPLGHAGRYSVFSAPAAITRSVGRGGSPQPYRGLPRW